MILTESIPESLPTWAYIVAILFGTGGVALWLIQWIANRKERLIPQYQDALDKIKKSLTDRLDEVEKLREKEREEFQGRIRSLEDKIDHLETEVKKKRELEEELGLKRSEIDNLRHRSTELKATVLDLTEKWEVEREIVRRQAKTITEIEQDNKDIRQRLAACLQTKRFPPSEPKKT